MEEPPTDRWSPVWALLVAGAITLVAAVAIGYATYGWVTIPEDTPGAFRFVGAVWSIFLLILAVPAFVAGVAYLARRRRAQFNLAVSLFLVAVMAHAAVIGFVSR